MFDLAMATALTNWYPCLHNNLRADRLLRPNFQCVCKTLSCAGNRAPLPPTSGSPEPPRRLASWWRSPDAGAARGAGASLPWHRSWHRSTAFGMSPNWVRAICPEPWMG